MRYLRDGQFWFCCLMGVVIGLCTAWSMGLIGG